MQIPSKQKPSCVSNTRQLKKKKTSAVTKTILEGSYFSYTKFPTKLLITREWQARGQLELYSKTVSKKQTKHKPDPTSHIQTQSYTYTQEYKWNTINFYICCQVSLTTKLRSLFNNATGQLDVQLQRNATGFPRFRYFILHERLTYGVER